MTNAESTGKVGSFDQQRAEAAVRELLFAVGEDPDREGLRDTPARVARAYKESFAGLHEDPTAVLERTFSEDHQELVLVRDIPIYSTCEHHLVPFLAACILVISQVATAMSLVCPSWRAWRIYTPNARRSKNG